MLPALLPAELLPKAAKTTSFSSIKFEEKFEISADKNSFPFPPNIDAVIHSEAYDVAIEAKFTEPYSGKPNGLKAAYIEKADLWKALPALHSLAKEISPDNSKFRHLDAAQLVKHILGLKKNAASRGFCLLYLWYDVFGEDGARHRAEIEQFAAVAKADGIQFGHITYQEVIVSLAKNALEGNEVYCDYMIDRYL